MNKISFDFVPLGGFDSGWLKELYIAHVARSRAVGKDGTTAGSFLERLDAECDLISRKVNNGTYQFTTYREKLIARGAQRPPRQISVPTIRDRLALRGALHFLKAEFPTAQPKPPHAYIKEIKNYLAIARHNSSFLRMDICDFYPSLNHTLLDAVLRKSEIPEPVINLIMKAVKTKTGSANQINPDKGVPQGLSISNALAAIYMIDFDQSMGDHALYRRYVDDILVIDHSERIKFTYQELWAGLKQIGLKSHPMGVVGKTETKRLAEGVQYLGYEISPLQISVRPSSLAKMFANLARVITCFKYRREKTKHIFRLNLKITGCIINNSRRGWLMYFSQTENISQLAYLDNWLKEQIKDYDIELNLIKSFKRAYYEIRYNLKSTDYVPNFDNFSSKQKKEVICILSFRSNEQVEAMDIETIEYEFNRLVGKEVSELERDLVEAFS